MRTKKIDRVGLILLSTFLATATQSCLLAADWPTYRHDNRRSGVTGETLSFPLSQRWVLRADIPPQAAWTGPAKWDAWAGNSGLQSMRNFDPCFYVTILDGQVFYGSSVDDAVHAIDLASGKEDWVFFTGASVRFPPTLHDNKVYFGSDDGVVYSCDQKTGDLIWRKRAALAAKPITSNRKIIATWPVRTGVMIENDKAFFAGSLVPWEPSYLWKVDAATGNENAESCYRTQVDNVTLQGALLGSSDKIYIPQGRAAPLAFDIASGKSLGALGEAGGVFCVLTDDEMLLAGPPDQKSATDQIRVADGNSKQRLATFAGTHRILVDGQRAWLPTNGKLKMLNRSMYVDAQQSIAAANAIIKSKKGDLDKVKTDLAAAQKQLATAWKWEIDCPTVSELIKAGDAVVVGLENEVRVYTADTGDLVWKTTVDGTAHGLAVADGVLLVSTGLGHIYALESKQ